MVRLLLLPDLAVQWRHDDSTLEDHEAFDFFMDFKQFAGIYELL